jgi:type II secretory pathway component PulF
MIYSKDRGLYPQSLLRFLAACIRLGMSPLEAVRVFSATFRLGPNKFTDLQQMEVLLAGGAPVSAAIGRISEGVPPWLLPLVKWSEDNGRIALVLDAAARLLDLEARVGLAVVRATTYPLLLTTVVVVLSILLILGPWSSMCGQFISIFNTMTPVKSEDFCTTWPFFGWLTDWAMETCAHPTPRVLALAGLWGAFLVLWFREATPGHRWLHLRVEGLLPGIPNARRTARAALQLELLALGLESGVPLPELLHTASELAIHPGEHTALEAMATQLEQGTPFASLTVTPAGPVSQALLAAGSTGLQAGILRGLSQRLQTDALVGIHQLAKTATPLITILVGALVSVIPVAQFLLIVRLNAFVVQVTQ